MVEEEGDTSAISSRNIPMIPRSSISPQVPMSYPCHSNMGMNNSHFIFRPQRFLFHEIDVYDTWIMCPAEHEYQNPSNIKYIPTTSANHPSDKKIDMFTKIIKNSGRA